MLAMSYKHPYTDLVDEKDYDNKFKTEYFKQHYLYSALIWYHNSFDLVLQGSQGDEVSSKKTRYAIEIYQLKLAS
ncbi:hypothetical protein SAMN04487852_11081 [Prevotella sp. tf2-5]|nr:hypothetical protein SAMN04487852_11081 [Prevotella sp. tf2-5]